MAKPSTVMCVLLASVACHSDKAGSTPTPSPRIAPARVARNPRLPLRVESLGSPVRSARAWTTALVPNARGGWNFITQSFEPGSSDLPEWVVADLDRGTYSLIDATQKGFANSNFQVRNQLRAANGRVFFPLFGTALAYYDPTDEMVKQLPPVITPPGPDRFIFSAVFGPDGMLYGGTQSNGLPTIVQIDPDTLKSRVLGHVGRDRKTYSYAYRIAVDPPWVYSIVGEMPWELAALNMKTRESKILATRADRGWMDLQVRPEGVRAQLITGVHTPQMVSDYVWCVDGKIVPFDPKGKLPFKPRNHRGVARSSNEPAKPPELDLTQINPDAQGTGRVRWRPAGSITWKVVEYHVKQTMPVAIEALAALPDGSVLGGTMQYHGFFKTRGSSTTFLGGPSPSRSVLAVLDGTVYITGYPNSVLYAYDPRQPWTGTTPEKASALGANPRLLGNFTQSGAKYSYFLKPSRNRLYFAGRLERDGIGAGVGYYEPATKRFGGHHDNLLDVMPAGLAVLPGIDRVVLSERLRRGVDVPEADLVVYDNDLAEVERLVVKPGLTDTGGIYPTSQQGVILGVVNDAVYRYDVVAKKLLDWQQLPAKVQAGARRSPDGALWVVLGTSLVRIDPRDLQTVTFGHPGDLPAGIERLAWQGDDLYASVGPNLYRIARVGLP